MKAPAWTLSAFADEISPDLGEQLDVLAAAGIAHMELRSVWGSNVASLDATQLDRLAGALGAAGVAVSAIGSPVGKSGVHELLAPELERLRRVCGVAERLGARTVRVFSFFIPEGTLPADCRPAVMEKMAALASLAEERGVLLAHENEKGIYGDTPQRCADILGTVGSPALRAVFDPANFVQCGVAPYTGAYPLLRPWIEYVHVKDALAGSGEVTVAGQGDGEVRDVLGALASSGFSGVLSLEPHLAQSGRFGGFSGPERFGEAAAALRKLLADVGVEWR